MKFQLSIQSHNTGMVLEATPDDTFDGQPKIARLLFDTIVANTSPEQVAVAAALLYGDYVGHDFYLDTPIARQAAEAIQDYLNTRRVSIRNLSDVPRSNWPTAGTLHVQLFTDLPEFETTPRGQVHGHQLFLADGTMFNGALGSPHQSIVASNIYVFAKLNEIDFSRVLLAHGILFSRDLHMRTIEVPKGNLSNDDSQRIADLVRAVDVNARFI